MKRVLKILGLVVALLATVAAIYYVSTTELPIWILFGLIIILKYYPINVVISNAINVQFEYGHLNFMKFIPIAQYRTRTTSNILFILFAISSVGFISSAVVGYLMSNAILVIVAFILYFVSKIFAVIIDLGVEKKLRELEGSEKLSAGKVIMNIFKIPLMILPILDILPLLTISTLAFKFRKELEDE